MSAATSLAPILIGTVIFAFIFVSRRAKARQRVAARLAENSTGLNQSERISEHPWSRIVQYVGGFKQWFPTPILSLYAPMLRKAGFQGHSVAAVYIAIKCLLTVAAFVTASVGVEINILPSWITGLQFWIVLTAWSIPDLWLWRRMKWYSRQVEGDLPFWLDLHTTLIEGGMGFDESLARLCSEVEFAGRPIFTELGSVYRRMLFGEQRSSSLKRMSQELQLESLDVIVASLIQSEKMGSSIGDTLRIQADMIRNKVWEDAQERAHKLPTQLIFPIAVGVLPSLFLVTIGPSILKLV
jgi:tight adherence protein C